MKTIEQVESQFEQKVVDALRELDLLPQGFKHRVRFHGEKKDKRKTADFEKNWHPDADSIRIWFEPTQEASGQLPEPISKSATAPSADFPAQIVATVPDPLSDMVRALDRAESRRGYDFVSLKWFRDAALPSEGFSWASSDATRQNLLRGAIEKRLILTSKVPNPKSPQFPVTAIRLNRLMPEVKTILGGGDDNSLDFHPVEIRGENLSATILRERR
jgi:hypothetical protein